MTVAKGRQEGGMAKNDCPQCGQDMRLPPLTLKEFNKLEDNDPLTTPAVRELVEAAKDALDGTVLSPMAADRLRKALEAMGEG